MEKIPGPDKKKRNLGLALALYGALAGAPEATAHESFSPDEKWFSESLSALPAAKNEHLQRMEGMVQRNAVRLPLQIQFLEHSLKSGGSYSRELHDTELTYERLVNIFKLVDGVSARINIAFWGKHSEDMKQYFQVVDFAKSTHYIHEPSADGKEKKFCNVFYMRSGSDVYMGTAAHCVRGTLSENNFYYPKNADAAVQYIPPQEYTKRNIQDPAKLPDIRTSSSLESLSGKVVASFGWALTDKSIAKVTAGVIKPKMHFSFVMPSTDAMRKIIYEKGTDERYPYIKNSAMYMKPPEEGRIVSKSIRGQDISEAAGTSGGPVGVFANGSYTIFGNFMGTVNVINQKDQVTYTGATSTLPTSILEGIAAERASRMRSSLK